MLFLLGESIFNFKPAIVAFARKSQDDSRALNVWQSKYVHTNNESGAEKSIALSSRQKQDVAHIAAA